MICLVCLFWWIRKAWSYLRCTVFVWAVPTGARGHQREEEPCKLGCWCVECLRPQTAWRAGSGSAWKEVQFLNGCQVPFGNNVTWWLWQIEDSFQGDDKCEWEERHTFTILMEPECNGRKTRQRMNGTFLQCISRFRGLKQLLDIFSPREGHVWNSILRLLQQANAGVHLGTGSACYEAGRIRYFNGILCLGSPTWFLCC